jgi:arsenite-transporting ATPase
VLGALHAEHVDAQAGLERLGTALADAAAAARLVAPPGADAVWGLLRLGEHAASSAWDVIVVDGPPAGEALRLLALPELARGWLDRLGGEPAHALRPFARVALDVALPGGRPVEALAGLGRRLAGLHDLLRDEETAGVRLVCGPGGAPRDVARRLAGAAALHGVPVDAVVLNRVEDPGAPGAFAPLPVLRAPALPGEARGAAALGALGRALFGDGDPAALRRTAAGERLEVDGDGARQRLGAPFAAPDDVAVQRVGDSLVLRVDGHKRALALPPALHAHTARGARVADGELVVRFEAP